MYYNPNGSLKCTTIILLLSFPGPEKNQTQKLTDSHCSINPYMPEVEIFEFVHDIHICYLENFKEQEFETKKFLLYSIVEL